MKTTLLFASAVLLALAQPATAGDLDPAKHLSLTVTMDRANALYHTGDKVTFTLRFERGGRPVDGARARWVLSKDGVPPIARGEAVLSEGEAVVEGRLDEPGFLRCDATFEAEGAPAVSASACAGVDPWLILPSLPAPDDFDAFWRERTAGLAAVPVRVRLKPVASSASEVAVFDLQADCVGEPVSGFLARPAGAKPRSLPAILTLPDAGVRGASRETSEAWARRGLLALDINAHGLPNSQTAEFYSGAANGALKDYEHQGFSSRESSYLAGMYLRGMRAIDALASQPEWDGRTLIVVGAGQGAGVAVACAGLDPRVTLLVASKPGLCDLSGSLAGRAPSWPRLATIPPDGKPDPDSLQTSRYLDAVNFAGRVKGDAVFTVGFLDEMCPPTGVYSAFNQLSNLKLKKRIIDYTQGRHEPLLEDDGGAVQATLAHIAERRAQLGDENPEASFVAPYPPSSVITGVTFDDRTIRVLAEGSDMWPITWAGNGNLYTCYGDGGGFGGTDNLGRVSFGVARVEGGRSDYRGYNVAGGEGAPYPSPFNGKGNGIIALGNTLYLWRAGDASSITEFKFCELWRSDDLGAHWRPTGVRFGKWEGDFAPGDEGFYNPVFCEFGRGNAGARDDYLYMYAPDTIDPSSWYVQVPGRISLFRVPSSRLESKADYEFFAGFGPDGRPRWTKAPSGRKPVWSDPVNGTHRMAVSYNPVLKRYFLTTVTVNRHGWMSIYDAPEPWGPWTHVHTEFRPTRWGTLTILFSFVNKWLSPDGTDFVMIYAKNDHWASIEGHFSLAQK